MSTDDRPALLHHYTCTDAAPLIKADRQVIPHQHPLLRVALVWLTDLPVPDRFLLGLTASWLTCDRTQVRVDVRPGPSTVQWGQWAHTHPVAPYLRRLLEAECAPAHWWVSPTPVPVVTVHTPTPGVPPCLISRRSPRAHSPRNSPVG